MHEVVDDQLRASVEELGQGPRAFVGLEAVLLLDRDPGQLLWLSSELVTAAGQLLLTLQQPLAGLRPLLAAANRMLTYLACLPRFLWRFALT